MRKTLTPIEIQIAHLCAKGSWQHSKVSDMAHGEASSARYNLRGRARNYGGKYERSFFNLLDRLKGAGFIIDRTPGSRGGEWSATYRIFPHEI